MKSDSHLWHYGQLCYIKLLQAASLLLSFIVYLYYTSSEVWNEYFNDNDLDGK